MDPQQRVLLEETAALLQQPDGNRLQGLQHHTTVAIGISKAESSGVVTAGNMAAVAAGSGYLGTGQLVSAAAGRISYTYGLKGPCGE